MEDEKNNDSYEIDVGEEVEKKKQELLVKFKKILDWLLAHDKRIYELMITFLLLFLGIATLYHQYIIRECVTTYETALSNNSYLEHRMMQNTLNIPKDLYIINNNITYNGGLTSNEINDEIQEGHG